MSLTPILDDGVCVHDRLTRAQCQVCADICPTGAMDFADSALDLDPARCTGCGACAVACPTGALRLPGLVPVPRAMPDRQGALLIVCPRHPAAGRAPTFCLAALGVQALAALWLDGVRHLAPATSECGPCDNGPAVNLDFPLARLNALLRDRDLPGMTAAPADARQIARLPRLGGDTPDPRRRALLVPAAAAPATPPLERLQRGGDPTADTRFLNVPVIDAAACTGCGACLRLCPPGAMILRDAGQEDAAYVVDPAICTGCGLCVQVCESSAVEVRILAPAVGPVALSAFRCRGCGVASHVPVASAHSGDGLCPICARTGQFRRLFQVLK